MGLALDEPRDGDETYQIDGISVIVDPFAYKVINESGGVAIKTSLFGPTAELTNAAAACAS